MATNRDKMLYGLLVFVELSILVWVGFMILDKLNYNPFRKSIAQVKGAQSFKYFVDHKPNAVLKIKPSWDQGVVQYALNSDALNENTDYKFKKTANTYRIIALGDSFTFGSFVETRNNWTELLETRLNKDFKCDKYKKFEVINMGTEGYDIPYEVEMYKRKGQKYNPDLLVWMLVDSNRIVDIIYPLVEKCQADKEALNSTNESQDDYCWVNSSRQINRAYAEDYLSQRFNGIYEYFNGPINIVDIDGKHKSILKKTTDYEKLKVLNIDYHKNDSYQLPDYHPSKEGHKYFADKIYDYLIANVIDCN